MVYKVYKLIKYDIKSNSHTVGRSENWEFKVDSVFEDIDDAKYYIMKQSSILPDFIRMSYRMTEKEKDAFIEDFCFKNINLLKYNKYFLDPLPLKQLKELLIKDGVKVE